MLKDGDAFQGEWVERLCGAPPPPTPHFSGPQQGLWVGVTHRCCSGLWLKFFHRNPEPWIGKWPEKTMRSEATLEQVLRSPLEEGSYLSPSSECSTPLPDANLPSQLPLCFGAGVTICQVWLLLPLPEFTPTRGPPRTQLSWALDGCVTSYPRLTSLGKIVTL